ncbi:ABC transporter permease [Paramicrobacterium chengjingii]|uniref:ABC transporter permease n=1 Tax=Paramicrobacterium chengjingii TaxID=2769067 RepID=UPI001420E95F|nr:ABC transporter permease [Microbacterium chengjingii]
MTGTATTSEQRLENLERPKRIAGVLGNIRKFGAIGPLGSLIALVILLSFLSPYFFEVNNLFNVFQQITVLAVIALGATMVIITGGIDLSVGSVAALSGMVAAVTFSQAGLPMAISLALALAVGALAGLANGLLIVLGRVPPFVATLAMLSIARGLTLVLSNGQPVSGFPDWFRALTSVDLFAVVPGVVFLVLVLFAIGALYLKFRPSGREIYAVGGNEEVARLSGINVGWVKLRVYMLAGALAGLGGLLLTSRLNSAQPTAGTGLELDVIAAVVIGGTSLSGGVGTVIGTLIGALIIGVLRNGLNLLDVSSFWQQVVIGLVIAAAVMIDTLGRRRGRQKS